MPCRFSAVFVLAILAFGCQPHASLPPPSPVPTTMTQPSPQFILSGGVVNPGPRQLLPGDTVAVVIARNLPVPPGKPITIVLIRQAPEGKTRQLIQLDATGKLMDEKQNWALRNGDELVFPGGEGSNSTRNPTGPPPRSVQ